MYVYWQPAFQQSSQTPSYILKVDVNHCFPACGGRLLALREEAVYQVFLKGAKVTLVNVGCWVGTGLAFITESKV